MKSFNSTLFLKHHHYQLWHVVEDDQVCPSIGRTKIAFVVHSAQLTNSSKGKQTSELNTVFNNQKDEYLFQETPIVLTKQWLLWRVVQLCTVTLPVYISTIKLYFVREEKKNIDKKLEIVNFETNWQNI